MNKNIFAVLALSILINNAPASAAETQKLPAPLINGGKPLMETLAARRTEREFSPREIDAQTLSEILWSAWGISHGDKRTVPTSQNLSLIHISEPTRH